MGREFRVINRAEFNWASLSSLFKGASHELLSEELFYPCNPVNPVGKKLMSVVVCVGLWLKQKAAEKFVSAAFYAVMY
jgi:hypothetical protein